MKKLEHHRQDRPQVIRNKPSVRRRTCEDAEADEVRRTDGAVEQVLDEEMAVGVDQGQEGGRVDGPAAEVEGAQEAQRARQQRPHTHRSTMDVAHCTTQPGLLN
jgi:hypothetical protein